MGSDRRKLSEDALTRIQKNLAATLGLAALTLAVVGQAASIGSEDLAASFPVVPGGPFMLVLITLFVMQLKGLFVASEIAVTLLRPVQIRNLKEKADPKGPALERLLNDQANASAACKLGRDVSQLAIFLLCMLIAPSIVSFGEKQFGWQPENYWTVVLCIAALWVFPVGPLTEIFEQAYRGFAIVHPHGTAYKLSKFITVTSALLSIPARAATSFSNLLAARIRPRIPISSNQAEEEIKGLVESAKESGEIEQDERELLHSVFEFSDTIAREVMTPRVDLDAMSIDSTPEEIMQVIKESGHSRIPIYEGTDDQIVGIIHAKDLLLAMVTNGKAPALSELMRQPLYVPENKPLNELLTEMKTSRSQMAIVNDEYGGTAGVVTIEDIVEELVGDIVDEYDIEEPALEASGNGWAVDGKMHLDDLNYVVGSDFESEEFETIGGLVFGIFGRQPREGEIIEIDGYKCTILVTDGRRVERLLLEKVEATS